MTKTWETNQKDLRGDGRIILYQRISSTGLPTKVWHCRIKHHLLKGYVRKTTRHTNYELAASFAYQLYDEVGARYVRGDVPVPTQSGSPKCSDLIRQYSSVYSSRRSIRKNVENINWSKSVLNGHVTRYFVEQLHDPRVKNLTKRHITGFFEYCRNKTLSENSIRRLYVVVRGFLKWLEEEGQVDQSLVVEPPQKEKKKRVSFTPHELTLLERRSRSWVKDGREKGHYRSRFYCRKFFLIMSNCGCRNGELFNLKWQDISRDPNREDGLVLDVIGKTQNRYALLQTHATKHLRDIYDQRRDELGQSPPQSEFVFCHKDGRKLESIKKSFRSLLEFANLVEGRDGSSRSLYSLRHSYAEMRILEGLSVYQLAAQMGTSVEMLEHHYGDMNALRYSSEITKSSKSVPSTEVKYPF